MVSPGLRAPARNRASSQKSSPCREIFGFGTGSPEPTDLDWSRVTTIAWAGANTTVTRADAIPAERFERGALAALERDHLLLRFDDFMKSETGQ